MSAPYGNIDSKLDRAICAYLIAQKCGSVNDTLPWLTQKARGYPNTTAYCSRAVPDPVMVGNWNITEWISVKGQASKDPKEPNPALGAVNFDNRCASLVDAMSQSDNGGQSLDATARGITAAGRALAVDLSNGADPAQALLAANNADMVDFTVLMVVNSGFARGAADMEGCSWERIFIYDILCCPSNVD
jgi:hypothetical protein